jgi:competence protein ComEC
MSYHHLLYLLAAGFLLGVFLRSGIGFSLSQALFILSIGGALILTGLTPGGARSRGLVLLALIVITFGLGVWRTASVERVDFYFADQVGQKIEIEAIITDEPDERERSLRLVVSPLASPRERILVVTERYPRYQYGDKLIVRGQLKQPENFSNEAGKEFDYIAHLAKDDIYYQIFRPEIEFISAGHGQWLTGKLFKLKAAFMTNISRVIPDPAAALLGGLVVGAKQGLGTDLLEDFRRVGLSHIVVLSGYNVTVIANSILKFFSFLPRVFGLSTGAVSIVLFAIMTGGGPTVVRASIMALIAVGARATGRIYDMTIALVLAAVLMVAWNPRVLLFDVGFQLSFIATLGIIYGVPIVERYLRFLPQLFGMREAGASTISAQVFVFPWILYKMGDLSLAALPANLLVLVWIPATMLFGFLAGMAAFVSDWLAWPFATVAYFLLAYQLWVVETLSNFSWASISFSGFPVLLVGIVYIAIALCVKKLYEKET